MPVMIIAVHPGAEEASALMSLSYDRYLKAGDLYEGYDPDGGTMGWCTVGGVIDVDGGSMYNGSLGWWKSASAVVWAFQDAFWLPNQLTISNDEYSLHLLYQLWHRGPCYSFNGKANHLWFHPVDSTWGTSPKQSVRLDQIEFDAWIVGWDVGWGSWLEVWWKCHRKFSLHSKTRFQIWRFTSM